jgi:hypothetical protein
LRSTHWSKLGVIIIQLFYISLQVEKLAQNN